MLLRDNLTEVSSIFSPYAKEFILQQNKNSLSALCFLALLN